MLPALLRSCCIPCSCLAAIPAEQSQLWGLCPPFLLPQDPISPLWHTRQGATSSGSPCVSSWVWDCRAPLHPGRVGSVGSVCAAAAPFPGVLWFLIAERLLSPGTQQDLAFLLNISCRHMQTEAPACFQFGFSLLLEVHK